MDLRSFLFLTFFVYVQGGPPRSVHGAERFFILVSFFKVFIKIRKIIKNNCFSIFFPQEGNFDIDAGDWGGWWVGGGVGGPFRTPDPQTSQTNHNKSQTNHKQFQINSNIFKKTFKNSLFHTFSPGREL